MNSIDSLTIDGDSLTIGRRPSGAPLYHRKSSFGEPLRCALDRNGRARLLFLAEAIERRTRQPGNHGGAFKLKGLAVLRALVLAFYNLKSGECFPSYEEIAAKAGCAPSTVAKKLRLLEAYQLIFTYRRKVLTRFTSHGHRQSYTVAVQTSNSYTFPTHVTGCANPPDLDRKHAAGGGSPAAKAAGAEPIQAELEFWAVTSQYSKREGRTQLLRSKFPIGSQP